MTNTDDALDEMLLTDLREFKGLEIVRRAYEGLVHRFKRTPAEARLIVADRLRVTPEEVDRAIAL